MVYMYLWAALATGVIAGLCIAALMRANGGDEAPQLVGEIEPLTAEGITKVGSVLTHAGVMLASGDYKYESGDMAIHEVGQGYYTIKGELVISVAELTQRLPRKSTRTDNGPNFIERNFIGRRANDNR